MKLPAFFSGLLAMIGGKAGNVIADTGKYALFVTIGVSAWNWLQGHGNEQAVAFSWWQMFWIALLCTAMICVAHRANFSLKQGAQDGQ